MTLIVRDGELTSSPPLGHAQISEPAMGYQTIESSQLERTHEEVIQHLRVIGELFHPDLLDPKHRTVDNDHLIHSNNNSE